MTRFSVGLGFFSSVHHADTFKYHQNSWYSVWTTSTNKDHSIITKFLKYKVHTYFISTYILIKKKNHLLRLFKCLEVVFPCKLAILSSFTFMSKAWHLWSTWVTSKWDELWFGRYLFLHTDWVIWLIFECLNSSKET